MDSVIKSLSDAIYYNLIREQRYMQFIQGLGISLQLTLYAAILGTVIGLFLALAKLGRIKWLEGLATLYVDVIRGTPAVVQLVLIYYAILGSSNLPKIVVASVAFGINSGAYVCELIRAGIWRWIGADGSCQILGFSYSHSMIYIIIPQAIKYIASPGQ